MIRVLRAADRIAVPWKNGGGITREVAAWPPGAGFNDFDWRVSIAEVREAGPFSPFPNIDRTLMVLDGRMQLTFANQSVELANESAPFAFPGDVPCKGAPLGGPVTDFNVMARRGRAAARIRRRAHHAASGPVQTLIVALTPCEVELAGQRTLLAPHDAIFAELPTAPLAVSGDAYFIEFVTAAANP